MPRLHLQRALRQRISAPSTRMMKAVLEREYQCQCRGSWRGLFPNAAILALRHAPADGHDRRAFDEPNQAVGHVIAWHVEEIAGRPAVFVDQSAEIAKEHG